MKFRRAFFCAVASTVLSLACLQAQPADVLLQEGVASLRAKNFQQAEALLRRAYEMDNSARSLEGLAEALISQNKAKEAIDLVSAEVAKDPQRKALWMCLANTAILANDFDLAAQQYQALIQETVDPLQLGDLYRRLGECYRRKGDMPKAIVALRKAREKLPTSADTVAALASALDTANEKQEAMVMYRAALNLRPDNPVVLNNLAYAIEETDGNLDEALRLALRARELAPNVDDVADTLASIYVKKHEPGLAIGVLLPVMQRSPARSDFRKTLAKALDQRDAPSPEVEEMKALLRNSPTPENTGRLLQLLPAVAK